MTAVLLDDRWNLLDVTTSFANLHGGRKQKKNSRMASNTKKAKGQLVNSHVCLSGAIAKVCRSSATRTKISFTWNPPPPPPRNKRKFALQASTPSPWSYSSRALCICPTLMRYEDCVQIKRKQKKSSDLLGLISVVLQLWQAGHKNLCPASTWHVNRPVPALWHVQLAHTLHTQ